MLIAGILPPGDKFKILLPYEIVQVAQVITAEGNNLDGAFGNLEDKWRNGGSVYDIDLIGLVATPLSPAAANLINNSTSIGELAKAVQEQRDRIRKECKKEECKRKRVIKTLKSKINKKEEKRQKDDKNEGEVNWVDLLLNDGNVSVH